MPKKKTKKAQKQGNETTRPKPKRNPFLIVPSSVDVQHLALDGRVIEIEEVQR